MKSPISKKGFTLIELLIVIAIIAVLAIAFVPTLLSAPAKGRDSARVADLQKIQKVLINANLEGSSYPSVSGDIGSDLEVKTGGPKWGATFTTSFGGVMPDDPQEDKDYNYYAGPGDYAFGLSANVELFGNANTKCSEVTNGKIVAPDEELAAGGTGTASDEWCYAIFTE